MRFTSTTIDSSCLFLFLATIICVIYKKFFSGHCDPTNCDALVSHGHWLDPPGSSHMGRPYSDWSPSTCMMHKYRAKDIRQCIGTRKIVFVGDSQMRQLFWAMAKKLSQRRAESELVYAQKHSDLVFMGPDNATVDFIWDPYLNSTGLLKELTTASIKDQTTNNNIQSAILIISGGLWFAKNLNESSLQRFSESMENILDFLEVVDRNHTQMDALHETLPQTNHAASLVMFAPIQSPLYTSLDRIHAETLTPARIHPLQLKFWQTWRRRKFLVLWSYGAMTAEQPEIYQPDGLHFMENVADAMVDLMLNIKCNSFLTNVGHYPLAKTCCSQYPQANRMQLTFIFVAWSSTLIAWLMPKALISITRMLHLREPISANQVWPLNSLPPPKILKAISTLLLALYYCWWADRTPLLNKAQKHYSDGDFAALSLLALLIGMFSLRQLTPSVQRKSSRKEDSVKEPFLSRSQTDEWKGWMQLMILIYHYSGASKVLWIYKIIRLLVAAYLFLTGYGHTMFFYKKADYSLRRVAGVLIRLNMLSWLLPYIMNTEYIFYYFAPLVSFWYLIVYATMAIGRSWNKVLFLLIIKIMVSATITTFVIRLWPGIFVSIFFYLGKIFNIHWDAADWQFRLRLDEYIVYIGMLVGVYSATNEEGSTVFYAHSYDRNPTNKLDPQASFFRRLLAELSCVIRNKKALYITITFSSCVMYAWLACPASDKETHNMIFSAVSMGPVLAFVGIRNACPWIRRYYSSLFAWMGQYSLETFILQYHIWLAADTKGILSTGLFDRTAKVGKWADFTVLTVIFLWVCWHVAKATQTLTAYIVDPKSFHEDDHRKPELFLIRSDIMLEALYPNEEVGVVSGIATGFIAEWLFRCTKGLKLLVAESLWARLVVILLVAWGLNITYS